MSLAEHLEKLRHFHNLTNYRSINEGAKGMGMSQAGLSKSIASLEAVLEVNLFIRSQDGLMLTKEGALLLATTKRILLEATDFEANLRALKATEVPNKFRIGMYDSIAVYFFPDLVDYLKSIYPSVELELVVDSSSKLSKLVQQKDIDLAVGVNLKGTKTAKTEYFPLFEDHFSFFMSPKVTESSNKLPLIFNPEVCDEDGTTIRNHLQHYTKGRVCHHTFNFETIKTLAALGLGIGILPTQVAKPLLQQKQLVPVKPPKVTHFFGKHSIGFLASVHFLNDHRDFVQDVYRLGQRWSNK